MLKPVSFLFLPVFLMLPIGIVEASDLDVQTNGTHVTINQGGGIRIESADNGTIVLPSSPTTAPINPPVFDRYQPWWSNRSLTLSRPVITPMHCSGGDYSEQISQSSSSGTSVSRTYSSTSTRTCR